MLVNTLKPRHDGHHFTDDIDGHHFPDDIFKCFLLNENVSVWIKISLKFVPKGPISNIPALVQIIILTNDG